jgi:anti-sigma B factor antagonist
VEAFRVERRDDDGKAIIAVFGEVDLATAPELKESLLAAVASGATDIVLDLSATDFLDSTGLSAVVAAYKRVRAHDGTMQVVVGNPRVRRVFEITNLDRVLPISER